MYDSHAEIGYKPVPSTSFPRKRESSASDSERISYVARRRGPLDPRLRGDDAGMYNVENVVTTDNHMIPIGYMAKKVAKRPDWIKNDAVKDIYSVSGCVSECFADYIKYWQHNGYWFFDSADIIFNLAKNENIDLSATTFFYYETYERQYDQSAKTWGNFQREPSFKTNISLPKVKKFEGYDVVTFTMHTNPECSPLSCNSLAEKISVNSHCLLASFEEAKQFLEDGKFDNSEPGPFRILAVYSLPEE